MRLECCSRLVVREPAMISKVTGLPLPCVWHPGPGGLASSDAKPFNLPCSLIKLSSDLLRAIRRAVKLFSLHVSPLLVTDEKGKAFLDLKILICI